MQTIMLNNLFISQFTFFVSELLTFITITNHFKYFIVTVFILQFSSMCFFIVLFFALLPLFVFATSDILFSS